MIHRRDGFTFLELAVVITIIGIMTMVVAPRFSATFSRVSLGGTARHLAGTMGYLRNLAAKDGRTYYLNINLDENEYLATYLRADVDVSQLDYDYLDFLDEEVYARVSDAFVRPTYLKRKIAFSRVILEDGTEAYQGVARIEFRPDGTADETVIHLTDSKERFYTVYLEGYNGEATVYRGVYIPPPPPELTAREPPKRAQDAL
jgi:prepilin-type N-terminal cleavage/methylation domain-containing protein